MDYSSGLIFSKSIDNCAHASQAKCNEKRTKAGAAGSEKGPPPVPTTTPFPEFDYDYYYYYDDSEYVDPVEAVVQPVHQPTSKRT